MHRNQFIEHIQQLFQVNPIVAILGPRQCGKTTLARMYLTEKNLIRQANYFDLERHSDLVRLTRPEMTLSQLQGLITIDEIQRVPELFTTLRVLIDDPKLKQRYLILGSASRELIKQSTESLAGRISYLELTPFNYSEVDNMDKLWLRGGFPRSFLADNYDISFTWREDYIRTFLEQDIPQLGIRIASAQLHRFWLMLTHYHGAILNASEMGCSLGLSHTTVKHYADILSGTFMIRQLTPWYENIKKRQVKSSKIYFRDSGLYHTLLGIHKKEELWLHPKLGVSWEGFVMEELIRHHQAQPNECYFWGVHNQAELDLLIIKNGRRLGFEIKFSDAPKLTKSMHMADEVLKLDKLTVIYPGKHCFPLSEAVEACGLEYYLSKETI